jgi:hypothetical protein
MKTTLWIAGLVAGLLQVTGLVSASYGVLREREFRRLGSTKTIMVKADLVREHLVEG